MEYHVKPIEWKKKLKLVLKSSTLLISFSWNNSRKFMQILDKHHIMQSTIIHYTAWLELSI